MSRRLSARELEARGAAIAPPRAGRRPDASEPLAMLHRRGFETSRTTPDLPFSPDLGERDAEAFSERLDHYAFRLFLRGAIARPAGFTPAQATRYITAEKAREQAETLVGMGLAERLPRGRCRLVRPAHTFGGTLEWWVGRELARRFGFEVATGVQLRAHGVGGDLDVVAAAEGKLLVLELKSAPPKHLRPEEVAAFFDRLEALRPDLALFVVDTALRLTDKVVPMLEEELARRARLAGSRPAGVARRVQRDVWALTPRLYAVGARVSLIRNVGVAIAAGLRALSKTPV